ncbi:MAG: hypothetical protein NXH94_14100 [Rhodobacteraceae bacterium]|uniref:hypothetical protein n=1 Tax=Marivita sp. TaxID=2003365 RepID=UPI003B517E0E|nr:hypothetical protein [Paracoccaceae bacterium]
MRKALLLESGHDNGIVLLRFHSGTDTASWRHVDCMPWGQVRQSPSLVEPTSPDDTMRH